MINISKFIKRILFEKIKGILGKKWRENFKNEMKKLGKMEKIEKKMFEWEK